jgi:hypothetical protein
MGIMADDDAEIAKKRDAVMRRLIAMPPKSHKDEPKRRPTPSPKVRQLPKRVRNRKRTDEAGKF